MHQVEFATRAADVAERARQLAAFTGHAATLLRDDGHEASIRGADLGEARVCAVALGGHVLTDECVARDRRAAVKLLFQEEGRCVVEQAGREVALSAGEWCAYDKSRPFRITADGFSRQTTLSLAFGRGQGAGRWTGHMMQRHRSTEGADHVLHLSLLACIEQVRRLDDGAARRLGEVMRDLADTAFLAKAALADPVGAARRARVLAHVDRHLADPGLDIDRIAQDLLCSKRHLHSLFAGEEFTLARVIWNRRLARCGADLADPALAESTITDIALSWGFNDSHHFSRLFRERYRVTPRDYRKAHLRGGTAAMH